MRRGVRLACSCEEAIQRITAGLEGQGFRVVRSFDLREALAAQAEECPCPYHGTERCTCSYTMLLVYGSDAASRSTASPGSLRARRQRSAHDPARYLLVQLIAVHGHHDETWLTLLSPWRDVPAPALRQITQVDPTRPLRDVIGVEEPSDTALDARLVRGLAAAMTETPG